MVLKPTFSAMDIKAEPVDRSSPGPVRQTGGRKTAANVKSEMANGYGSPLNATDDGEPSGPATTGPGLRGAGGKRKARGPAAASIAAATNERLKRAKTAAAAVIATPASSTGGSSSEAEASESENEINNGTTGRAKKGPASALAAREGGKGRGKQRNSDSSSSSKEGQPVRKGRGGGGASGAGAAAAATTANNAGTPGKSGLVNPLSKPPIAQLKKTGERFLQVLKREPTLLGWAGLLL